MFLVAEEEITWFDILMQNIAFMTICQSGSTLQGYSTELINISSQLIVSHRTATQILHQFIVAMLTFNVCLTIVIDPDNHLKIEIQHSLQNVLVDIEVGIINLQYIFFTILLDKKHLSLTRVITQALDISIFDTFQQETVIIDIVLLYGLFVSPDSSIHSQRCRNRTGYTDRSVKIGWTKRSVKISRTYRPIGMRRANRSI